MADIEGRDIARIYFRQADDHGRKGLIEHRNKRPIKSKRHTQAMKLLSRAARAERDDPKPLDLGGDTKLLGPGDLPAQSDD
jgi:hypothetical protein